MLKLNSFLPNISGKRSLNSRSLSRYKKKRAQFISKVATVGDYKPFVDMEVHIRMLSTRYFETLQGSSITIDYNIKQPNKGEGSLIHQPLQGLLHPCALSDSSDFQEARPQSVIEVSYSNGDFYNGSSSNGIRCGNGVYVFKDGSKLYGTWTNFNEQFAMFGIYEKVLKHNGSVKELYQGFLRVFCHPDLTISSVIKEGFGECFYVYRDICTHSYCGSWHNDQYNGFGKLKWIENKDDGDSDLFFGYWSNSERHGDGFFFNASTGGWYQGHWSEGRLTTYSMDKSLACSHNRGGTF